MQAQDLDLKVKADSYTYTVLLTDDDSNPRSWIEGFRIGSWVHKVYGKITGTMSMFETIVRNFKSGVVGRELVVDYQHSTDDTSVPPEERGKAAGWIKDVKIEGDRLMLLVEWTEKAAKAIKAKEWRYFSPTYDVAYRDRETGKDVGVTLLGGALTNTPFLTGLAPVNLSDFRETADGFAGETDGDGETNNTQQEVKMKVTELTPELQAIWLKAYDATDGTEAEKAAAAWKAVEAEKERLEKEKPEGEDQSEETKSIMAALADAKRQVMELQEKLHLQQKEAQLRELAEPVNGRTLPPIVLEQTRRILMAKSGEPIRLSDNVEVNTPIDGMLAVLSLVKQTGLVTLSEQAVTKSSRLDDSLEITDEDRAKYPGDDTSVLVAKLTDRRWHSLPKEERNADAYARILAEVTKEVNIKLNKE